MTFSSVEDGIMSELCRPDVRICLQLHAFFTLGRVNEKYSIRR